MKILIGTILLIVLLLFAIPIIFKEKIKIKVEQVISESVYATVKFDDYKLGFFRNFPNLTFSLNGVSVVGQDKFENDTLAGFKSLNLVFNLLSLVGKTGYEVKSIVIDQAVVHAIVLKDGTANWDIMKDTTETVTTEQAASQSEMKILLKKVIVQNSSLSYIDDEAAMKAYFNQLNFNMKGDMTMSQTDLQLSLTAGSFTYIMDGMKYLNNTVVDSKIDMLADLDSMKFTFRENYLSINDLKLKFSGMIAMPGDDIKTDITFGTDQTSFKTILSLVPAIYMNDYKELKADGQFSLTGSAKGIYSDADSTMPDISLALSVKNGLIAYPALPEQIKNINIKSDVFIDGEDMDKTLVGVEQFHMELAGNPFDMNFALKTPMSDPDFKGSMIGRIDLSALAKAIPMDSISLSGIIDMSLQMAGRMSMIEKQQYASFNASGKMGISNMLIAMTGYPEVKITEASFEFTPAYASMTKALLIVGGRSDYNLSGRLENYIPYFFSDKTIRGTMKLHSKLTDVSEILSKMADDSTAAEDTASLSLMLVPKNIAFDFDALIDEFSYDSIKAQKVKGHIIIHDGMISIKDAGMNILTGTISMNADYDTRDTLKPRMKADLDIHNIAVKDAFNTFNTIKKLAPAAKGIDGRINAVMAYESLLGRDMMPVVNTISGSGKIQSDEITLLESATFDKMKETLKLGNKYSNTFKDINISFKIADGRIYVSPFNVKTGNLKMNISGDQGIDQTINYRVKTEIPRSDLGSSINSFIDNLSAQASALGISYKPADILKVNVKVTGTFSKPVVAPDFGGSPDESSPGAKETVKAVVKETIDNTVDKAREKAREEAEIQGAKIVKEAEEKGQQLRDEAAKAAEKLRKEADAQAQKLIDDASTKNTLAKMGAKKGAESIRKNADKNANQIVQEADVQADKLVEEAKARREDLIKKI